MSEHKGALAEYLFVDKRRLDSYFEQISDPVKYDKVPTWRIALQLSGPSAEGLQARAGRPFSTHEKILALKEHLRSADLVSLDPTNADLGGRPFVERTLTATQMIVPPQQFEAERFEGAHIWIEDAPVRPAAFGSRGAPLSTLLILLENVPRSDDERWMPMASAYTSLLLLSQELHPKNTARLMEGSKLYSPSGEQSQQDFARNPIDFLVRLGGRIASTRRVRALYRMRVTLSSEPKLPGASYSQLYVNRVPTTLGNHTSVTLGYPVFISAAEDALVG